MLKIMTTVLAGLLILTPPVTGKAAEQALALNLDEALAMAMTNNPGLKSRAAALDVSRWRSRGSTMAYLPGGAFTSSVTRVDDNSLEQANQAQAGMTSLFEGLIDNGVPGLEGIVIDPFLYRDTYRSSFTVNQEFPLNLHLIGGSKLARAGLRASRQGYAAGRDALRLDVRQAYFRLLAGGELLQVAREALSGAENRSRLAAEREELGMINRSDRMLWEVVTADARADLAAAETSLSLAEMDLNRLMGRPLQAALAPAPVDESHLTLARELAARELDELCDRALTDGPLARGLAAGEDAAAAGKLLAFSGLVPSLHFSFRYGWRENDTAALDDYQSWSATALLSVPIFDLGTRWSGYREARADERRQHHQAQDARASLRLGVAAAWHELRRSEQALLHRETAAEQAGETLGLMKDRYELGHISEFDLVDVQTARNAARAMAIQARYQHYEALATLECLLGGGADALAGEE